MEQLQNVTVNTANDYQKAAMRTCTASSMNKSYMALEIASEAGEVAGKVAKLIRDDNSKLSEEKKEAIAAELGDVMWGLAGAATVHNLTLEEILEVSELSKIDYNSQFEYANITVEALALVDIATDAAQLALCDKIDVADDNYRFISTAESVNTIAHMIGTDIKTVCQHNIDKLTDRFNRKQIHGSGDNR